jgi:hypothetical protein
VSWDARFFIAIFPNGEWCKVHTFSGGRRPDLHCLSALEGIDGGPQQVALIGRSSGVERRTDDARFEDHHVTARGVVANVAARDRFYWIRAARVLSYYSATGFAEVSIDGAKRDAFGVLEHAWGAQTRLDVAALAPRKWQWDVVSLGGERFFAGLAIHGFGAHGAARFEDGKGLERVSRLRIRAKKPGVRWSGTMVTSRGALRYEARAATPVSPEVDGGGFVGFTWEGALAQDGSGARVSGSGFSEFRSA